MRFHGQLLSQLRPSVKPQKVKDRQWRLARQACRSTLKFAADDRDTRDAWIAHLVEQSKSDMVARIGNIVVLFRRSKDKPLIILPKA